MDPSLEIAFQSYAEAYSEDFEDCRCRVPDLSRLRQTIAFEPQYTLDDVIREVDCVEEGSGFRVRDQGPA